MVPTDRTDARSVLQALRICKLSPQLNDICFTPLLIRAGADMMARHHFLPDMVAIIGTMDLVFGKLCIGLR